ncbi:hypothetical protein CDL15_Pgr013179 [Punica granatum]|uniref:Uncharacterized protein n=1 Tax=Punica granatum TaxID=22663 RepID=A0A218XL83_PUNGR|nr:hypothetical protein CDL15_Pgr013179 [Punica granatum]
MMISYRLFFFEHRWLKWCGATLDDFRRLGGTTCRARQPWVRRRGCPLGFHAHRDEIALSVLCPWGGGVFDLSEADFAARAIACYSARCRLYRRGDCSLLGMPRSRDEGLELWGRAPTYPEWSEIRVRRSSCGWLYL